VRAVVQRVSRAEVRINGEVTGKIDRGLVLLVGVQRGDGDDDIDYIARKTVGLRIFPDEDGRFDRSLTDTGLSVLVVSQFTLLGDVRRGRRPSFTEAMAPGDAEPLYQRFVEVLRRLVEAHGGEVATGEFQAMMEVDLVNDGPVTILLDSTKQF